METEPLLDHFSTIADAPGGVGRLRELILDLAVRGRLVPQRGSDGLASDLIEQSGAERLRRLAVSGLPRKAVEPLTDDDIPFEVPLSWKWVRLATISTDLRQGVPTQPFHYIDVGSIDSETGVIGETSVVSPEAAPSRARKAVQTNSVVYSTVRPYLRNIAIVDRDFEPPAVASTAFSVVTPLPGILSTWVFRCLRSPYFTSYVEERQKGVAYPAISDREMRRAPIPLPPTSEQQRITAKIDELMTLCDDLEARQVTRQEVIAGLRASSLGALVSAETEEDIQNAWSRVYTNWESITGRPDCMDDLRRMIPELAVRGRLVRQDPDDEPASTRIAQTEAQANLAKSQSYAPVDSDEMPYELPRSWSWVRLGSIALSSDSGWSPHCNPEPRSGTEWGVLKVSAVSWGKFRPEENKALPPGLEARPACEVHDGDFLISRANTEELVARSVVVERAPPRLMMSDKIVRFTLLDDVDNEFVNLANSAAHSRAYYSRHASGTSRSMKNVGRRTMSNLPIPLPPAREQRRIVLKVRQLTDLLDQLERRTTEAMDAHDKLATSVVFELTSEDSSKGSRSLRG